MLAFQMLTETRSKNLAEKFVTLELWSIKPTLTNVQKKCLS